MVLSYLENFTKTANEIGLISTLLAPNVSLNGELTTIEGTNITFDCDYDDVVPIGTHSALFYFEKRDVLRKVCNCKFLHETTY